MWIYIIINCRPWWRYLKIWLFQSINHQWLSLASMGSQEVIWSSSVDVSKLVLLWSWVELEESVLHEFIDLHDGGLITASVAVVWSWENSDNISVVRPIITVHYKLMCSSDELQVIWMIELLWDILSKRVTSTSWRNTPTASIIWIRPQKITDWTFMRDFHVSIELLDLIKSIDTWGETTMEAEDAALNNGCEW